MNDKKPQHEIRLGAVKAAIWKNENGDKGTTHKVTFTKLYKKGEKWESTTSFGRSDLQLLAKLADQAHTYLYQESSE